MKKNKKIVKTVNTVLMILSLSLLIFSGWKFLFQNIFIPYMLLFTGSLMSSMMFIALVMTGSISKYSGVWTFIAIFNSALFVAFYFSSDLLKELYPLSLWLTITILVSSLQQILERYHKRHQNKVKIFNYGIIIALIPVLFLKFSSPLLWMIFGWATLALLLINFILFVLPSNGRTQSR